MKILDLYVLRKFLGAFFFSVLALSIIFVVVNMMENLDGFIDEKVPIGKISEYYIYYLPEILKLLFPIGSLLATLFSIGRLSTGNEITAMKTGGLSVYRLLAPLAALSLLVSLGHFYFSGWIAPKAYQKKLNIERTYLKKNNTSSTIYNFYNRDNPNRNFSLAFYDPENKFGSQAVIEDFSSSDHLRLIKRTDAEKIVWDSVNKSWTMINALEKTYNPNGQSVVKYDKLPVQLSVGHDEIKELQKSYKEMNFVELKEYIQSLERGGKDTRVLIIDFYGQEAFPFANFIVVLFGVPFASVKRKAGIAVQIGAAMAVSIVYLTFTKISQTIGYSTEYNPIFIAWFANGLFLLFGLINLKNTRT